MPPVVAEASNEASSDDAPADAGIDVTLQYADAARLAPYEEAAAAAMDASGTSDAPSADAGPTVDYQTQCNAFIAANFPAETLLSTCTQTELVLFEKESDGGTCLACALKKACIDDNIGTGDTALECDDLASTDTAPSIATVLGATAVDECLAFFACALGVSPAASPSPLNASGALGLGEAYCGVYPPGNACSTGHPGGACVSQIAAGLSPSIAPGSPTISNLANQNYPTGQAGTILTCLLRSTGGQCGSCVN
jgi:hypothetical protein